MWRTTLWLVVVGLVVAGCQPRPNFDTPPDMRYGEDVCDQCRMIISEARFASAYVTRDGHTRRFDDIGGMLHFHTSHAEDVAVFWVHDYETQEWLKADQAVFVTSKTMHTPMGHGIVAFGNQGRAAEVAAQVHGVMLRFGELPASSTASAAASGPRQRHVRDAGMAETQP